MELKSPSMPVCGKKYLPRPGPGAKEAGGPLPQVTGRGPDPLPEWDESLGRGLT